jgi:hypothetical protein
MNPAIRLGQLKGRRNIPWTEAKRGFNFRHGWQEIEYLKLAGK